MGRWRAIVPVTIGLVVAIGVSWSIYRWMQKQAIPKEMVKMAEFKSVPVSVAAVDLAWGTKLTAEMIKAVDEFKAKFLAE